MNVKDIKKKVAAKVAKGKAKVAKGKAKVAKKCGKCAAIVLAGLCAGLLVGCQNPAQRAQTSEICECVFTFNINTSPAPSSPTNAVVVSIEIGNQAQANETGGNDAGLTASPTTDVKPEVAVGVGGSSAGTGKGGGTTTQSGKFATIGAGVDAAASLIPSGDAEPETTQPAAQSAVKSECEGGACEIGDCPGCGEK